MPAGSTSRSSTMCTPSMRQMIPQPAPAMWKHGMATMPTLSGVSRSAALAAVTSANIARCATITPFGNPVVPDV